MPESLPPSGGPSFSGRPAPLVLIVDDQPDVRLSLGWMIEALGFRVAEAANATRAFDMVFRLQPDVLLVDLHLGLEDGVSLIRRARELPVPPSIIAMSGIYPDEVLDHVLEIADAALAKPISKELLLQTIRDLVQPDRVRMPRP